MTRHVTRLTLAAVLLASTAAFVHAFNPQPDPPGHYYSPVGIVSGEALEIHVANTRFPAGRDGQLPPGPCRADILVLDANGGLLARQGGSIEAGQTLSLTYAAGREAAGADRLLARGVVLFSGKAGHCVSSLEVVDVQTGHGLGVLNPGLIRGFNPQPEPPGDKR